MIVKLETAGLVCPFPLVEAKETMAKLNQGDGIEIEFDCTQATEAIPNWAAEEGYEVTNFEQIGDAKWTITVVK
ncbi:sulfurtransferase TusA family protein [Lonepinella sp. BR2357]|uniref:sulfurtransferase TusA family protein n=1 Tax=Lonepinella sp. BR2357 TaxID=3434549 RepID=UPI003F6DEFA9